MRISNFKFSILNFSSSNGVELPEIKSLLQTCAVRNTLIETIYLTATISGINNGTDI